MITTGRMRSRAVLLPHFGDPACLYYWLSWFSNWAHTVDAIYIGSSNILNKEHEEIIKAIVRSSEKRTDIKHELITSLHPVQHGDMLNNLLELVYEKDVMLIEEDTVVFKPAKVEECFRRIEDDEVDAVGSARESCSAIITEASSRKYGDIPREGVSFDQGYNFWPNFFFCHRIDLLRTDRDFNSFGRTKGTAIPELGIDSLSEDVLGDTFVWTSIQLRNMGLRFGYTEQFHGHPDDPDHFRSRTNVFSGKAGWVHHGSLSGWRDLIEPNRHPVRTPGLNPNEMARRLAWYLTFQQFFEPTKLLPKFCIKYLAGIERMAALYDISMNQLQKRQLIYQRLFEGRLP